MEFLCMTVSAEFTKFSYTFIVPENSTTHVPLAAVDLVHSQTFKDFEFQLVHNISDSVWRIFPDGMLYITSPLDCEKSRRSQFECCGCQWREQRSADVFQ